MLKVLLTFDVEEFDVPEEFGHKVDFEKQIEVSTSGLNKILELLNKHSITCTFFTTATYALQNINLVKSIAEKHEIASHGFYHSSFSTEDLLTSKKTLETIINGSVNGFRMARLAPVDEEEILKAGYSYNSSLNPTWIPGRYNHLGESRVSFYKNKLFIIPVSVSPWLRIPLFWLSFKNFPFKLYKQLMMRTLKYDKVLSLYFHPWEFTPITNYHLPRYISKDSGEVMLNRLEEMIVELKKVAEFTTMNEFRICNLQK